MCNCMPDKVNWSRHRSISSNRHIWHYTDQKSWIYPHHRWSKSSHWYKAHTYTRKRHMPQVCFHRIEAYKDTDCCWEFCSIHKPYSELQRLYIQNKSSRKANIVQPQCQNFLTCTCTGSSLGRVNGLQWCYMMCIRAARNKLRKRSGMRCIRQKCRNICQCNGICLRVLGYEIQRFRKIRKWLRWYTSCT